MKDYNIKLDKVIESNYTTSHTDEEKIGLEIIYNNIKNNKLNNSINREIFTDLICLQQTLYSKCGHYSNVEFRKTCSCISKSDVTTCDPSRISNEIFKLNKTYIQILNNSKQINTIEDLIRYILKSIKFMCKIVEIHPFADGNGRTSRAIFDYLLRQVDIPPVNVISDKHGYLDAIDAALRLRDYSLINKYYTEKIFEPKEKVNLQVEKGDVEKCNTLQLKY